MRKKKLLNLILTERRKKKWSEIWGIDWMDGMPLTKEMIKTFYDHDDLDRMLFTLMSKGYLVLEHPKKRVQSVNEEGIVSYHREKDTSNPKGYNM